MTYVDGFVAAVPTANKAEYIEHATAAAAILREYGALKSVECWGDGVPAGEIRSFSLAVKCAPDETVVFSWILWPSHARCATRQWKNHGRRALRPAAQPDAVRRHAPDLRGFEMVVDA